MSKYDEKCRKPGILRNITKFIETISKFKKKKNYLNMIKFDLIKFREKNTFAFSNQILKIFKILHLN